MGEDIQIADDGNNHCVNGTPVPLHKLSSFTQSIKNEGCGSHEVFPGGNDYDYASSSSSTDEYPPVNRKRRTERKLAEMFSSEDDNADSNSDSDSESNDENVLQAHQPAGADLANGSSKKTTTHKSSTHAEATQTSSSIRNTTTAGTAGPAGTASTASTADTQRKQKGNSDKKKGKDMKKKPLVPKDLLDSDEGRAILLRVFTVATKAKDGVASVLGHGKIGPFFASFVSSNSKISASGTKGVLHAYTIGLSTAKSLQSCYNKARKQLEKYFILNHSDEDGDRGENCPKEWVPLLNKYRPIHEELENVRKSDSAKEQKKKYEELVVPASSRPHLGANTSKPHKESTKPKKKKSKSSSGNGSRYGGAKNAVIASAANATVGNGMDVNGASTDPMADAFSAMVANERIKIQMEAKQNQMDSISTAIDTTRADLAKAERDKDTTEAAYLKTRLQQLRKKQDELLGL